MKFNYQQLYDHYPQNDIFRSINKDGKQRVKTSYPHINTLSNNNKY